MGAGVGIGGFLTGFGQGFLEAKERREKIRHAAIDAGIRRLVDMTKDPNFDPNALADVNQVIFQTLGDLEGGKGASRGPGGKKNDPMQHMQQMVGSLMQKQMVPPQPGAPPVLSPRVSPEGGRETLAQGSPGALGRKGPFLSQAEMRTTVEEDERRRAQIREQETLKRQQLQLQMRVAEKKAEEEQRLANFRTMVGTGMSEAEAFGMNYPGRANPYLKGAGLKASTPVVIELNDGTKINGWEDKFNKTFTRLDGSAIEPKAIKSVNPKAAVTGDKGVLGELEAAQAKVDDPKTSSSDRKAAQLFIDSYKHRDVATTLRIQGQQSTNIGEIDLNDPKYADKVALARQAIRRGGGDPSFGLGANNPDRKIYYSIKGQLLAQMGDQEAAAQQAEFAAGKSTLTELMRLRGQMKSAEKGTVAEVDRLLALNKTLPRSKIRAFNSLQQFLAANLSDAPELARFREALLAARYRYNSMITSLRSGGTSTNQVRSETADEIINRSMAAGTIEAAANEMKVGISNVMKGMDQAVDETRRGIGGGGQTQLPKPKNKGQLISTDEAVEYINAAGGDVEKGKKMARDNGYQVP